MFQKIKKYIEIYNNLNLENQEKYILTRLLKEIEWNKLSDDEKQESRIILYNTLKNKSNFEKVKIDLEYEKNVIDLYEVIGDVLEKIENIESLFRIKCMFEIEKFFINEHSKSTELRHNDYFVINNLFNEIKDENEILFSKFHLNKLELSFNKMYKSWARRPYKDI